MKETDMFERKTGEDSSGSVTYFINTVQQDVLARHGRQGKQTREKT